MGFDKRIDHRDCVGMAKHGAGDPACALEVQQLPALERRGRQRRSGERYRKNKMSMLFKQDKELTELRAYNSKTFGKPTGNRTVIVAAGHFHYYNKLGVGDGRVAFREIDNTLGWNEARRGWTFLFHNYQPFLP